MEQQAFDLVAEKVGQALAAQGFERQTDDVKEEDGRSVLFLSEGLAYSVLYDLAKKRFELRSTTVTEDGPSEKWKSLSVWLFDPDTDRLTEAESIANDFAETIEGPKRVAIVQQQAKKKNKKDEDGNVDPQFFFNRMASIFPELKDEMTLEKQTYGQLRNVTFAKTCLVPKVEALAFQYNGSDTFKKMGELFNDMYMTGDMDVRSIITIVIFNGVQNETAMSNIEANFSDDLKKCYAASKKMKGKVVKPEKKKKKSMQSRFMADTLNETRR